MFGSLLTVGLIALGTIETVKTMGKRAGVIFLSVCVAAFTFVGGIKE